ncbi:hypothetical protein FKW77_007686 [Venturia effusa]|uniref:Uncharacterized protein n=1 Tax=Venturia effusa TaxID=50376 RepID=A0A517L1N5_9PEZI|nr:hypothetical protein FKW77_007686 [Venturia effusa]
MSLSSATSPTNVELQSLLNECEGYVKDGQNLLSRLRALAPQMLAPREWVKLRAIQKLIDLQTQVEYAVFHEKHRNTLPSMVTKKYVQDMKARREEDRRDPQYLHSHPQEYRSQDVTPVLAESQLSGHQPLQLPATMKQRAGQPPVTSEIFTPQKKKATQPTLHSEVPETPGSGPVLPKRRQLTISTANSNSWTAPKSPVAHMPVPTPESGPNVQQAVFLSQAISRDTSRKVSLTLKRRRRATSEESEDTAYRPSSSSEGSLDNISPSPSASPTPAKRGQPPAKRRALPTTPIRRPPSATPRPALGWQAPRAPLGIIAKTNEQLLADFVLMSTDEVNAINLADLQAKFKGIKALLALANNASKETMIDGFMKWQNTMLELERGEEPQDQAITPSHVITPRRKIESKSDEELLQDFVFKSLQELNDMRAGEVNTLVRGVEALRPFFNGVKKQHMIDHYMKWQKKLVVRQQEREQEEAELEEEEEEDVEPGPEGDQEVAVDPEAEAATRTVAPATTHEVIDLTSDGEDEGSGETITGDQQDAHQEHETTLMEV